MASRVAVCLRGDMRLWDTHSEIFFSIYDNLPYDIIDYYVYTYEQVTSALRLMSTDGYRYVANKVNGEWHETGNGNRYHPGTIVYSRKIDKQRTIDAFSNRNLKGITFACNDIKTQSSNSHTVASQFYSIYAVNLMKREHEYKHDFIYDCVINTRVDACLAIGDLHIHWPSEYADNHIGSIMCTGTETITSPMKAQDISIIGGSLEMDIVANMFHELPLNYTNITDPHMFMPFTLNKTSIIKKDIFHPCIYRRDGFQSVYPLTRELTEFMILLDHETWHGNHKRRKEPANKIINNQIIKVNYDLGRNNAVYELSDIVGDLISHEDIMLYADDKMGYNPEMLTNFAHNYAEKLQDWDMLCLIRDNHNSGVNIVIRSVYSAEFTSIILHLLDIMWYVSKVEFIGGNNISTIFLDFDGVLVDTVNIHFELLNQSLKLHKFKEISHKDNVNYYNNLTTVAKLQHLNEKGLVDATKNLQIQETKKELTANFFAGVATIPAEIRETVLWLKNKYNVVITSNSDRHNIEAVLNKYDELKDIDIISKSDVSEPKPHVEMYNKKINELGIKPNECVVIDDSLDVISAVSSLGVKSITINDMYTDMSISFIQQILENL